MGLKGPDAMTREIRLPAEHPRFRPRIDEGPRRPGHPGTAVNIEGELYEVVAAGRSGGDWVYRLEPWRDGEAIRSLVDWGQGAEREFAESRRAERDRERRTFLAWLGQAFLGFLPASTQERLLQDKGLDPGRATLWSAALETAVGVPLAFLFLVRMFSVGTAGVPAWIGLPACVVAGEGLFRLATSLSTGEPMGSLFTALAGYRRRGDSPGDLREDVILEIEGTLRIVSPVPKVWWERAGGVTYKGQPFILAGWERERTRHIYNFRQGGEGFPALDPELEKARNRASDLSFVFAPLWGFLPPELQDELGSYGRYRARPYVLLSIGFTFLAALSLVGPGVRDLTRGVFRIGHSAGLAFALVLFAESALRMWRLIKDGRAPASLLAALVKPVYDRTVGKRQVSRP